MNDINDKAEMILDKIIKNMDDKTKNTLIKALLTHDKQDVWIQAIPIYEDICHEGHTVTRYITDIKYGVSVKHDVDTLTGNESHIIWLNEGESKI